MFETHESLQPDEITEGIVPDADADADAHDAHAAAAAMVEEESVTSPAKVMRIGSMVKQLLEEVRAAPLDEASRERLAEIYERSVAELSEALSPDLRAELASLALPFEDGEIPSESELRIAKAQLVGWLEGLFHGIQATLMAQQFAAQRQLQEMRQLPGGAEMQPNPQQPGSDRPGTYL
ncbi:MAG TPA: bacterial proteasome activator family protein [Ilumatobacteraceae bacterium]|nr:bacterial proteasome activator family protein [Ilumatobacteraceae bacterium]